VDPIPEHERTPSDSHDHAWRSGLLAFIRSPWILGTLLGLVGVGLLSSLSLVGGCQSGGRRAPVQPPGRTRPAPLATPTRAVWVARFHYQYPDDIRSIMRNCAALGANTVLWQVRGDGTTAYYSRIEPWSSQYDHRDPGYDPLKIAVAEAHRNGLRIEAWINVLPGWKGPNPPAIRNQLWHARPDWFLHDASGRRQPLGDFYVILNPCLPDVRNYITSVVRELAANYDLDGIHLDYVRYAWDTTPNARKLYPRDPTTLRLYRRESGKHPDDDSHAWDRWRALQITRLVGQIHDCVRRYRPGASLTAAVWSSPKTGYRDYLQDATTWLRAGKVDAIMPMAYTESAERFEGFINEYRAVASRGRIIPGLGLYKHDTPRQVREQLGRCRSWGGDFALFSYESLHAVAGDRNKRGTSGISSEKRRLRQMRLSAALESVGRGFKPE